MTTFIEKYFKVLVILLLLILCLLLWVSRNNGRYAMGPKQGDGIFILDTKTSELWIRNCTADFGGKRFTLVNLYLGTNKKPQFEIIKKVGDIEQ